MLWPTALFPGRILLLAQPGSFNAAYIRRTLEFCGAMVVAPTGGVVPSPAELDESEVGAIIGCIAVDLDPATLAGLEVERWPFPFLFVGGFPAAASPGSYAWMPAPFASYQVLDTLLKLMPGLTGAPARDA